MGLFSKKPKVTSMQDWLTAADKDYDYALQTKHVEHLQERFSRECCRWIQQRMRVEEKLYSGLDRYKHVTWGKKKSAGTVTTYVKRVTYDHIKIAKGIVAPVGDDYAEEWDVECGDSNHVLRIRRLQAC